jgi:hypothetical protein
MTNEELLQKTLINVEKTKSTTFLIGFMSALIIALSQSKSKKNSRVLLEQAREHSLALKK